MQFDKEKLLQTLQDMLDRQIELCNMKYEKAMKIEEEGSAELNINSRTKKENTDLKEYNACVSAVSNTIAKILAVNKAQSLDFEEPKEEELI